MCKLSTHMGRDKWVHIPDSKVHGTIWGQQYPGGPHVGPMNLAIWDVLHIYSTLFTFDDFGARSRYVEHE